MHKVCLSIILFLAFFLTACDSNHSENPVETWLVCDILGNCYHKNTRFGMVGDSWTDFGYGTQTQRDLYDWLESDHGYRITAINLAGQTLDTEVNRMFSHRRVIENGGIQMSHMLISLGGNDLLANISTYTTSNLNTVLVQRLQTYEENFVKLMIQANAYKSELYGGPPLRWYIHGYDYGNPELILQCNLVNIAVDERAAAVQTLLDGFNERLIDMTRRIPNLYYIDLRGTLGGPPVSNASLKFDCIHPNEIGFRMLAQRYATILQQYTQER